MSSIPVHQAIKFYDEADDVFNQTTECPCEGVQGDWTYIVKAGDVTEVQILSDCNEVTFDADIILNGSFETQGVAPSDAEDWTVDDTERVERANSDPYIGLWSMRWNVVDNGTATQDTGVNFLDGDVYLMEFYVKVVNPITAYETPLEVYVGGQNYEVTPTEDYTKITIPVVFLDNGIDQDVIFVASNISPMADFMYVDFVSLEKVIYTENNCEFDLVYNGNFEYGQAKVAGELPVVASFDGWEIDGTVEASLTGGFEGSRCPVLYAAAAIGQTWNVMADGNTYTIKFMAKAATAGDDLILTVGATNIETYLLTTEWTEYEIEYTASDDLTTITFSTHDNEVYLDNVSVSLVNFVNDDSVYVHDTQNDVYYTDPITINEFEGGYNALFGWAEILDGATPGCLQIITEFAEDNLITNSKFELGAGNLFTGWSLNPGNGSITQSTTGGLNGSRAVILTRNTNSVLIVQTVLSPNTSYKISFWAKIISGSPQVRINSDMTIFGTVIPTTEFVRYELDITTGGSDNDFALVNLVDSSAVIIDNVYISENGEGVHYSELIKYIPSEAVDQPCAPEVVWYDSDNAYGINYESGFKNKMRVLDLNFPTYAYPTEMTKTLNGLVSYISKAVIQKQKTINITPSPEFINDRLAVAVRHSNIEIGTTALCPVEETVYTVVDSETGCRLKPATVILGIEGEILAEKSLNCSE